MTLLAYLAQQHRFAKWQIRKLNALPSTDQNDDDLYFFERLDEYIQEQREYHRGAKTFDNADDFLDSLAD